MSEDLTAIIIEITAFSNVTQSGLVQTAETSGAISASRLWKP